MAETRESKKMAEGELLSIEAADLITRSYERLPSDFRKVVLRDLFARLTDNELALLDELTAQRRQKKFDILSALPPELQVSIVEQLSFRDVVECVRVCQSWRHLFLLSSHVIAYMVTTWFPLHRDAATRLRQDPRLLHQCIQDRARRHAGLFRSRLTTIVPIEVDGQAPTMPLRLQCLRNPRDVLYEDVSCSALSSIQEWQPTNCDIRYSDGYLACHFPGSIKPILVQDLRTMGSKCFTLPSEHLIRGSLLKLMAVGNQLVVGAAGRTLIAWNIATGASSQVSLPSTAYACVTRDNLVLVESTNDKLYAWESLTRLLEVDILFPEDDKKLYESFAPCSMLDRSRRNRPDLPTILHPSDRSRFFIIPRFHGFTVSDLIVYEFQRTESGYTLSQTLRYVNSDLDGNEEVPSYYEKVDNHGTFELWRCKRPRQDVLHIEIDSLQPRTYAGFKSIMFNTLTSTFSVHDYPAPQHPRQNHFEEGDLTACVWEGQALWSYFALQRRYRDSWSGFLFAADRAMSPKTSNRSWKRELEARFWDKLRQILAQPTRRDRTNLQEVGTGHNLQDEFYSEYGFRWVSSFPTDPLALPDEPPSPLSDRESGNRMVPLSGQNLAIDNDYHSIAPVVRKIWADEDFVVAATSDQTFTVFCTDPDRKWANAIAARH